MPLSVDAIPAKMTAKVGATALIHARRI